MSALLTGLGLGLGIALVMVLAPLVKRWHRRRRWAAAVAREPDREPRRLTREEVEHAEALEAHRVTVQGAHAERFAQRYCADLLRDGVNPHAAMREARTIYSELMGW